MSTISGLKPLSPSLIPQATETLTAAFHDDPSFEFLLPDEGTRDRWIRVTMRSGLQRDLPDGHVYTLKGAGIPGVIGLTPPGRYPTPLWRDLRALLGFAWPPPPFGAPTHFLVRGAQTMRAVRRLHVHERHWYVSVLGVEPSRQGSGAGRALLDPALAQADRDRVPTYLETAKERNVSFYQHFGFEVRERINMPGGGPPLWTMLRPPAG